MSTGRRHPLRLAAGVAAGTLSAVCLLAALSARAADEDLQPPLALTSVVRLEGGRISGTRQLGVELRIDTLTPRDQAWKLADAVGAAGQEGLLAALQGHSDGLLRLGAVDFPINLAVYRRDGDRHTFMLVSARAFRVSEVNFGMESTGYPFGVALFTLDSFGNGDGLVYPAARIGLDRDGGVVIDNYQEQPGIMTEVRLKR
jgi:hypothetical protein